MYNLSNDLFIMNFQLLAARRILNKLKNKKFVVWFSIFKCLTISESKLDFHIATCQASTKLLRTWYMGSKKTTLFFSMILTYSHLSNKRAASLIDFSFFALPACSFSPLLADTLWPLNSLKVNFFDLVINGRNIRLVWKKIST